MTCGGGFLVVAGGTLMNTSLSPGFYLVDHLRQLPRFSTCRRRWFASYVIVEAFSAL